MLARQTGGDPGPTLGAAWLGCTGPDLEVLDMRNRLSGYAGLLLALAVAAPAAANSIDRFSSGDVLVEEYSCGVVLTTEVALEGATHFGKDGSWLGTSVRAEYRGTAYDPATGDVIELKGRQIIAEGPDQLALLGQGMFIRLAGEGVVLRDVGRLVIDAADGSTRFASAGVIPFDDPDARERIDTAVCSLFD